MNLSVEVAGLKLKNPVIASSGPITDSPLTVKKCIKGGAGGIVAKTVTAIPELRIYTRPFGFSLDKFGLKRGRLGCGQLFADESPAEWIKECMPGIKEACLQGGVPLIQSIMGNGMNIQSWVEMAQMMEETGADALELNFSCPHSPDVASVSGSNMGMDPVAAATVTASVCQAVSIPVFTKMTSRSENIDQVAKACQDAGANGISMINVLNGLWVDVENMSYFGQPARMFGYPGSYMLPIALLKASIIQRAVNIPIYGGAGVWSGRDALAFILLGNKAVQLQLACMTEGYDVFKRINDQIVQFMAAKNINDLEEIRGKVLPQLKPIKEIPPVAKGEVMVNVIEDLCTGCGKCQLCMWGVLQLEDGVAKVAYPDNCHGCGWCVGFCSSQALQIVRDGKSILKF